MRYEVHSTQAVNIGGLLGTTLINWKEEFRDLESARDRATRDAKKKNILEVLIKDQEGHLIERVK